jgi:hypothetical protein
MLVSERGQLKWTHRYSPRRSQREFQNGGYGVIVQFCTSVATLGKTRGYLMRSGQQFVPISGNHGCSGKPQEPSESEVGMTEAR